MGASTQSLLAAVGALNGARARAAELADAVAGMQPQVVVSPGAAEEVAATLAFADREGLKVVIRGGGTQLDLGAPPTRVDILLDMTRLDQVIEHAPADQTVTIQGGLTLAALRAQLAQANQWLALDPMVGARATLGGLIATNATGARRLRYGGVRDQIIGVRVALADGTLASGGGKVVKNVAGYDLPKLFTGSLGTLGVIVGASFRLYPLPAAAHTVVITAPEVAPLCALALRVNASTLTPTILDVFSPGLMGAVPGSGESARVDNQPYALAARFESGVEASVADQAAALLALAGDSDGAGRILEGAEEAAFWEAAQDALSPDVATANISELSVDGRATLLLKVSLLPADIADWLAALDEMARVSGLETRWRAHVGHGLIYVRVTGAGAALPAAVDALRQRASGRRGSLVVQSAPPALARQLDVWGPAPALAMMRRLKDRFDPHVTLNPGRFVSGI